MERSEQRHAALLEAMVLEFTQVGDLWKASVKARVWHTRDRAKDRILRHGERQEQSSLASGRREPRPGCDSLVGSAEDSECHRRSPLSPPGCHWGIFRVTPGMVVKACNPRTGRLRQEDCQPWLQNEFQVNMNLQE